MQSRERAPGAVPRPPVSLTSLVGREREIGELDAHVSSRRQVTITGVGGSSQTRLAAEFVLHAFFLGCLRGRRGLATTLTGAAAVALYLVDLLAPQVEGVRWLETLSPFHYYLGPNPLVNGLSVGYAALLVGLITAFSIAAVVAFDRRDVAA